DRTATALCASVLASALVSSLQNQLTEQRDTLADLLGARDAVREADVVLASAVDHQPRARDVADALLRGELCEALLARARWEPQPDEEAPFGSRPLSVLAREAFLERFQHRV